jgi:hypothetical protein
MPDHFQGERDSQQRESVMTTVDQVRMRDDERDDECEWCGKTIPEGEERYRLIEEPARKVCEKCFYTKWEETIGPIRDELVSIRCELGAYASPLHPFGVQELRGLAGWLLELADRFEGRLTDFWGKKAARQ